MLIFVGVINKTNKMDCNFKNWRNKKCKMIILVNKSYDKNEYLLCEEVKVFYNTQMTFDKLMGIINRNKEMGIQSKGYLYEVPFIFVNDYPTEVKVYDNYEKIIKELSPIMRIVSDGINTHII